MNYMTNQQIYFSNNSIEKTFLLCFWDTLDLLKELQWEQIDPIYQTSTLCEYQDKKRRRKWDRKKGICTFTQSREHSKLVSNHLWAFMSKESAVSTPSMYCLYSGHIQALPAYAASMWNHISLLWECSKEK